MAITGEKGAIKSGEATIAKIESWKLNLKANEVDVTTFDSDGWEETAVTTKGWEVSCEGIFDKAGQQVALTAFANGTDLPVDLFIDKASLEADFDGNVKISGIDIDTSVKDKIKFSMKCKGNGILNGLTV